MSLRLGGMVLCRIPNERGCYDLIGYEVGSRLADESELIESLSLRRTYWSWGSRRITWTVL
jgi:hypothetical protein